MVKVDTKDPIGRAILNGLAKYDNLDGYVVSVYVEGYKLKSEGGQAVQIYWHEGQNNVKNTYLSPNNAGIAQR